jgi:hypothetical protein
MQTILSSPSHEQVSCRQTHKWYDLCGRSSGRGSLDAIYPLLRAIPEKILYTEFSESIIMPIRNSKGWKSWIDKNLAKKHPIWEDLAVACRFVFNFLFRPSRVLRDSLVSLQTWLGPHYIVAHIRTGHMEDGSVRAEKKSVQELVDSIASCKTASGDQKWLLLTDDVALAYAAKLQNVSETTIKEEDMKSQRASSMHTGKAHTIYDMRKDAKAAFEAALKAWRNALTDWLLIAQAPSLIFMRNRMFSAGSFGTRAAFVGGHACVSSKSEKIDLPDAPPKNVWR